MERPGFRRQVGVTGSGSFISPVAIAVLVADHGPDGRMRGEDIASNSASKALLQVGSKMSFSQVEWGGIVKEWLDVFEHGGALAWVACVVVLLAGGTKGIFALYKQKSQARKELLEFWREGDKEDDFWLETLIRHNFGTFLPACLIKYLVRSRSPGSRLAKLAANWSWFEFDAPNHRILWKGLRGSSLVRVVDRVLSLSCYAVLGMIGYILATNGDQSVQWLGIAFLAIAIIILVHAFSLSEAEKISRSLEFSDLFRGPTFRS